MDGPKGSCLAITKSLSLFILQKRPLIEVSSLPQVGGEISSRASDWLRGDPRMSFESWKQLAHQKAGVCEYVQVCVCVCVRVCGGGGGGGG